MRFGYKLAPIMILLPYYKPVLVSFKDTIKYVTKQLYCSVEKAILLWDINLLYNFAMRTFISMLQHGSNKNYLNDL